MEETIIEPVDQTKIMVENFCKVILGEKNQDFESDLLPHARVLEAARLSYKEKRIVKISEIN